jgi:naphthoate synthase
MDYKDIRYETKDGVAWLTMNRPDKGNMVRPQTIRELTHAFQRVREEADLRVAVLTGAGDRFFCIGGEHDEHDPRMHYGTTMPVMDLYDLIDKHPKPIIAMVNGFAVGGGNVLALMCDFTIASERAVFRQVGPMMGSFDAGFGTWYLEAAVGRKRAKEIWMLNRKISAPEALAMGLINEVVSPDQLRARVEAWCAELKQRGPIALAALKASFHARHAGVEGLSRVAHDMLIPFYYHSQESRELLRAFNAKEAPDPDKFYH